METEWQAMQHLTNNCNETSGTGCCYVFETGKQLDEANFFKDVISHESQS